MPMGWKTKNRGKLKNPKSAFLGGCQRQKKPLYFFRNSCDFGIFPDRQTAATLGALGSPNPPLIFNQGERQKRVSSKGAFYAKQRKGRGVIPPPAHPPLAQGAGRRGKPKIKKRRGLEAVGSDGFGDAPAGALKEPPEGFWREARAKPLAPYAQPAKP